MNAMVWMCGVVLALVLQAVATSPAFAAGAGGTPAIKAAGKPVEVNIRDFAFSPRTLTVPVGARVVWTNRDDEPHIVVSAGHQFATSRALDTSDSYAVTFDKPGTYAYYCSIHPMMVGTVIVQ